MCKRTGGPCSSVRGGRCSLLAAHHIYTIRCSCSCQDTCNWIFLTFSTSFLCTVPVTSLRVPVAELPVTNCRKYSDIWPCVRRPISNDTAARKKLQDNNMITWLLLVFLAVRYIQSVDSTNGSEKLANHSFEARSLQVYRSMAVKLCLRSSRRH
jgi:hypothetical protein